MENQTTKPMAKLKILQLVRKNLDTVGFNSNLSLQPCPFNMKILVGFLLSGSYFICSLMFICDDVKTFTEYTQSIYISCSMIIVILTQLVTIFNVQKLFKLISDCENLVNDSECIPR